MSKKHHTSKRTWTQFERRYARGDARIFDDETRREFHDCQRRNLIEFWVNNLYHVEVNHGDLVPSIKDGWPEMVWISIRRLERCRLPRDWRDLQRIKNEILGPEWEAVELYPRESRLNDESDQFHLWALADTSRLFPFGYTTRRVSGPDAENGRTTLGGSQRPFEYDNHHSPVPRCKTCARLIESCVCEHSTPETPNHKEEL